MSQTPHNPDWLDDLLQARPVDDDGFTARIGRFAGMQRRTALFRRLLAVVVFLIVVPGACTAFGLHGVRTVTLTDVHRTFDGAGAPFDDYRGVFRAAWARYDGHPALARRTGREVGTKLDGIVCGDRQHCDTSPLVGLAEYDQWTAPPDLSAPDLSELADQHMEQALAKPVVVGELDPFVAAATDAEALARLWMGNSSAALSVYRTIAIRADEAHALGRALGFQPALSFNDIDMVFRLMFLAGDYASVAGSVDDHAFLRASKSLMVCDSTHPWYERYRGYLDDEVVDRAVNFVVEGCSPATIVVSPMCDEDASVICKIGLAVARLPPWRQLIAANARQGMLRRTDEFDFIAARVR